MKLSNDEKEQTYSETLFKLKLMRIRAKISFSAFLKRETIAECFLRQIYRSYMELRIKPLPDADAQ